MGQRGKGKMTEVEKEQHLAQIDAAQYLLSQKMA